MKRSLALLFFGVTAAWSAPAFIVEGISASQNNFVSEAGKSLSITVSLAEAPTDTVTVTMAASPSSQVTFTQPSVTFAVTDPVGTKKTVVITGVDNTTLGDNPPITVTLSSATSADAGYAALPDQTFPFVNENNDPEPNTAALTPILVLAPAQGALGVTHTTKFVIEEPFDADGHPLSLSLCRDTTEDFQTNPSCLELGPGDLALNTSTEGENIALACSSLFLLLGLFFSRLRPVLLSVSLMILVSACGSQKLLASFNIQPRPRWSATFSGLLPTTEYFWTAYVNDGHGNLIQSEIFHFTSGATP